MTVLVTGAGGFIGRAVVARLRAAGVEVTEVRHRWHSIDELVGQVGGRRVDRAVHLGWHMGPEDPMTSVAGNTGSLRSSVELVTYLLGLDPVPHTVFAGSWWVGAYPNSPYGRCKRALHRLLDECYAPLGLRFFWANLQTVVGPGDSPTRVLPTVARALAAGTPVDLSPGGQARDYVDVDDAAAAISMASGAEAEGAADVGTGEATTLRAMCLAVARHLGASPSLLRFGARAYRAGECMSVVADPAPLAALGWRSAVGVDELAARISTAAVEAAQVSTAAVAAAQVSEPPAGFGGPDPRAG